MKQGVGVESDQTGSGFAPSARGPDQEKACRNGIFWARWRCFTWNIKA